MMKSTKMFSPSNYVVEDSVGYLLTRARAQLAKSVDIELAAHDITHTQGGILMLLASGQYSTAAELSSCAYIDSAAMTRMIDRLEKRGLLKRMPRGDDRRVINLELTPDGRQLADRLPECYCAVLNRHFAGFNTEEVDTLKALLRKLLSTELIDAAGVEKKKGKKS